MIPTGVEWMNGIPTLYLTSLIVASVVAVPVVVQGIVHLYYIYKFMDNEIIQCDLSYLCLLFPIVVLTSLLGLYLPRNAALMNFVALIYAMVCLLKIVSLTKHLFNGREAMAKYLSDHGDYIKFSTQPYCCCCKCLPTKLPTKKNLRYIEWMVIQSPVLRILFELCNVVCLAEENAYGPVMMVFNSLSVVSTLTGIYGCNIIIELTRERLAQYRVNVIHQLVSITHLCLSVQIFIFSLIPFSDDGLLNAHSKSVFWNGAVTIMLMCLLSCLASWLLSPKKTAFFVDSPHFGNIVNVHVSGNNA